MKKFNKLLTPAIAVFMSSQNIFAAGDLEWNTNRVGVGDYRDFDLPIDNPLLCKEACGGDPKCKSSVYTRSNTYYTSAHCWLKSAVPAAISDASCVSWVKPN